MPLSGLTHLSLHARSQWGQILASDVNGDVSVIKHSIPIQSTPFPLVCFVVLLLSVLLNHVIYMSIYVIPGSMELQKEIYCKEVILREMGKIEYNKFTRNKTKTNSVQFTVLCISNCEISNYIPVKLPENITTKSNDKCMIYLQKISHLLGIFFINYMGGVWKRYIPFLRLSTCNYAKLQDAFSNIYLFLHITNIPVPRNARRFNVP